MTISKRVLALCVAAPLSLGIACNKDNGGGGGGSSEGGAKAPTTEDEKTIYALGQLMARNLQPFNLQPSEMSALFAGIQDSVAGKQGTVDMAVYGPKVNELARARAAAKSDVEKKKGAEFQAKMEKEQGAQKTASGLIYFETQAGTGEMPTAADTVKVHYRGTLMDGTEFDSSFKRNQPAQFPLGGVIKCWTEGVAKMKVGGKAKLICPSEIAYGDRGSPPTIPPGATLIFEVELLEIIKAGAGNPGLPPGHP